MSALAGLVCSACHVTYVWRVTWRPSERRFEWRARPDCACNDAFGMPCGTFYVRPENVDDGEPTNTDDTSPVITETSEDGAR